MYIFTAWIYFLLIFGTIDDIYLGKIRSFSQISSDEPYFLNLFAIIGVIFLFTLLLDIWISARSKWRDQKRIGTSFIIAFAMILSSCQEVRQFQPKK